MGKVEILKKVNMDLIQLYKEFFNKLLREDINNLTLISIDELTEVLTFLESEYDDNYYSEEMYDMRSKETEIIYYMADCQIIESEYLKLENKQFPFKEMDEDNFEIKIEIAKAPYSSFIYLMPICFKEFYKYCEKFINKKEKISNEDLHRKEQNTTTKDISTNRKIAEKFLKNYEFIIKAYESLSKIVDDEQIINVFEMIFKNFGE